MEVDRHFQRLGTLEDRPELPFIMETAVGQAMDHRALEAKLRHGAFQLVGGGLRVGCRQRGEAGKADRMRAHRLRQPVVGLPRQAHRGLRIRHLLHRRRGVGDHLQVDAGLVHFLDATLAKVLQPLHQRWRAVGIERTVGGAHVRILEMLFERDDERLGRHGCSSLVLGVCHCERSEAISRSVRTSRAGACFAALGRRIPRCPVMAGLDPAMTGKGSPIPAPAGRAALCRDK